MPPKCVETIYHLPQVGKEIVQPSRKLLDIKHNQHHNRNRYGQRHPSESSAGDRGCSHHNRCGHVRRSQGITLLQAGGASKGRGFGENISEASFPIWGTI